MQENQNHQQILWIIFTDLDGTLLDENDYSFSKALNAISYLKDHQFPIIPCTSKTHQEVLKLRSEIGLYDPFIVENGSAIFLPEGCFNIPNIDVLLANGYHHITLGKQYSDVLKFFQSLKKNICPYAKGFSEMNIQDIMDLTGLDEDDALSAQSRSFSEPFVITENVPSLNELQVYARDHGFRILRGNRFFHLLGGSDKGRAVKSVLKLYREKHPGKAIRSIGLGDSPNDLEMLHNVDIPVLVNKTTGRHHRGIELPNLMKTKLPGPAGWQEAIFNILRKN